MAEGIWSNMKSPQKFQSYLVENVKKLYKSFYLLQSSPFGCPPLPIIFVKCFWYLWSSTYILKKAFSNLIAALNIIYVEFHLVSTSKLKIYWHSIISFSTNDLKEEILAGDDLTYFTTFLTRVTESLWLFNPSFTIKFRTSALHLTCRNSFLKMIPFQPSIFPFKCLITVSFALALSRVTVNGFLILQSNRQASIPFTISSPLWSRT